PSPQSIAYRSYVTYSPHVTYRRNVALSFIRSSWRFAVSNPADVVREFCALMERRDPDALRPLLADDAVYQNVGMPAFTGVDAIVENLGAQFSMFPDAYAFEIVNIASDGSVVLTERLDYIQTPDG